MQQKESPGRQPRSDFLSGVLACLDAVRDTRVLWPPDVLWQALCRIRSVLNSERGIAVNRWST